MEGSDAKGHAVGTLKALTYAEMPAARIHDPKVRRHLGT